MGVTLKIFSPNKLNKPCINCGGRVEKYSDCGLGWRTRIANSDVRTQIADSDCGLGLRTRTADSDCGLGLRENLSTACTTLF